MVYPFETEKKKTAALFKTDVFADSGGHVVNTKELVITAPLGEPVFPHVPL